MHDQDFPAAATPQAHKVLIAASDHRVRAALRSLVEADGRYVVVAAARSADEAVQLDAALHPQLILLDLLFPTAVDGLDTVRSLALCNSRPIVALSAQAALRDAAVAAGAAGFVAQGDDADALLAVISTVMSQR